MDNIKAIEMPRYRSHKTVWALKISAVQHLKLDTTTDENQIVRIEFEDKKHTPRDMNLRGKPTPETGWYLVRYADGYVSFSPEKEFEDGNTLERVFDPSVQPHQQRVIIEKEELDDKVDKLGKFLNGSIFVGLPHEEQDRLNEQVAHMRRYSDILGERIAAF